MKQSATGVYYDRADYLGLWRRLLIDIVDSSVVIALSGALLAAIGALAPQLRAKSPVIVLGLLLLLWFGYLVLLKRSRHRTLGYAAVGARIVNLTGERPSVFSLVLRHLFVISGPMNILFDVIWLTGDPNRQALRDKFASTYVIRSAAQPAGTGTLRTRTYTFWGMTFLFREVVRVAGGRPITA